MMHDKIEKIGNSVLQHGKYNDRIYLMKIDKDDSNTLTYELDELAKKNNYSKIFAKVPASLKNIFIDSEYIIEANIPNFYSGDEGVLFMSKFLDNARKVITNKTKLDNIIQVAENKSNKIIQKLPSDFGFREAEITDSHNIANIYKEVFESYPFPIYDEEYIIKTLKTNVRYFITLKENIIVAISSAEIDKKGKNLEMTDFATLPQYRGLGLAQHLLFKMEQKIKTEEFHTAYSIARAQSMGMNIVFGSMGYSFGGRLINNTQISGDIESMNIWYKNFK